MQSEAGSKYLRGCPPQVPVACKTVEAVSGAGRSRLFASQKVLKRHASANASCSRTSQRKRASLNLYQLTQPADLATTGPRVSEPVQEDLVHEQGLGLVKRLSMMRIMARRTNAATVLA